MLALRSALPRVLRPVVRVRAASSVFVQPSERPASIGVSFAKDAAGSLPGVDVIAVAVRAADVNGASWTAWDELLGGELSSLAREAAEDGAAWDAGKALSGRVSLGGSSKRLFLFGLGQAAAGEKLKSFGAAAGAHAREAKAERMRLVVLGTEELSRDAVAAVVAGVNFGTFVDARFKSKPAARALSDVSFSQAVAFEGLDGVMRGASFASGSLLARQLVNAPPNVLTPAALAEAALQLARDSPDVLRCTVLGREECEARGMGAFLGVSAASDEPPKFIHLTYTPPGGAAEGAQTIALVGKGLTFDSGGYNLKVGPGSMIEAMKFDMGGAGAVLGAARIISELQPAGAAVHFIIASCENLVGSRGLRPGDVLRSAAGKTIEVNNTDAEGRLTLADALHYAQGPECGARRVVDVATLTGACMVALGTGVAGLFSPDDALAEELRAAGAAQEEKLWRMPLEEAYWEQMTSQVADMKNTGMGKGGAITAALFLQKYVNKDVSWAHLDIAGPVWNEKTGEGTGFAAATLAQWVLSQSGAKRA